MFKVRYCQVRVRGRSDDGPVKVKSLQLSELDIALVDVKLAIFKGIVYNRIIHISMKSNFESMFE